MRALGLFLLALCLGGCLERKPFDCPVQKKAAPEPVAVIVTGPEPRVLTNEENGAITYGPDVYGDALPRPKDAE